MTCSLFISTDFTHLFSLIILITHLSLATDPSLIRNPSIKESALLDYNYLPHSEVKISDNAMVNPYLLYKRKNEFIRFGKREDDMRLNKRRNEFIQLAKQLAESER